MDIKPALSEQYHAGLAMLAECIEKCPENLWTSGTHPRTYWRIAFHAAFFTQLSLGQDVATFHKWQGCRADSHRLWDDPAHLEPYELPEGFPLYTREEMLDYIGFVDSLVEPLLEALDLASPETGFSWYEDMSKFSHMLMSLRHIQGHVGQLSELLMAHGIDTDWVSKASSYAAPRKELASTVAFA